MEKDTVLLTLQPLDHKGEEQGDAYISPMPNIPVYSSIEVAQFMEKFYDCLAIPGGYETSTVLYGNESQIVVEARVILPDFEVEAARSLRYRLEQFIEGELEIIRNGY